jgi:hypothetical protein
MLKYLKIMPEIREKGKYILKKSEKKKLDKINNKLDNSYWSKCKKEIGRIMKINGKVISFGWNTNGVGKNNGFEKTRIVLIAHGSQHNDTLATVEVKVKQC